MPRKKVGQAKGKKEEKDVVNVIQTQNNQRGGRLTRASARTKAAADVEAQDHDSCKNADVAAPPAQEKLAARAKKGKKETVKEIQTEKNQRGAKRTRASARTKAADAESQDNDYSKNADNNAIPPVEEEIEAGNNPEDGRRKRAKAGKNAEEVKFSGNGPGDIGYAVRSDQEEIMAANHREVERRIVAIQAFRDVQIDQCLTQLRLARSMCSEVQLDMPFLQFLQEHCPGTIPVTNADGIIELDKKFEHENIRGSCVGDTQWRGSAAPQGCSVPKMSFSVDGQQNSRESNFCSLAVNEQFLRSMGIDLHAMLESNADKVSTDGESSYQTPTMNKFQPSIGITPRTSRRPKVGEILLSVHGSPLGVYRENKMDTIKESAKEP